MVTAELRYHSRRARRAQGRGHRAELRAVPAGEGGTPGPGCDLARTGHVWLCCPHRGPPGTDWGGPRLEGCWGSFAHPGTVLGGQRPKRANPKEHKPQRVQTPKSTNPKLGKGAGEEQPWLCTHQTGMRSGILQDICPGWDQVGMGSGILQDWAGMG